MFSVENNLLPECEVGGLGAVLIPRRIEFLWRLDHGSCLYFYINEQNGNAYMTRHQPKNQQCVQREVSVHGSRCQTIIPRFIRERLNIKAHDIEGDYIYMQRHGERILLTGEPIVLPKAHCLLCCESDDLMLGFLRLDTDQQDSPIAPMLLCPDCLEHTNEYRRNIKSAIQEVIERQYKGYYYDEAIGGMTYGYFE